MISFKNEKIRGGLPVRLAAVSPAYTPLSTRVYISQELSECYMLTEFL
jgi:hypothetical protein